MASCLKTIASNKKSIALKVKIITLEFISMELQAIYLFQAT